MIGRKYEVEILERLLKSRESEFLTMIGRRRIGKTFIIRQTYEQNIVFEFTGIQYATIPEQLSNFQFALKQYFSDEYEPTASINSWLEAFEILIELLENYEGSVKPVIFLDELPWIATAKSDFIKALSFFWNSWASKNNIVLATCGSAASWMINSLINNKGGLHNRVTKQIYLQAFSLEETALYLRSREINLTEYQMVQLYMTVGGIPYYLKQVPKGKSVPQIVQHLFFSKRAPLKNEFINLYRSLFLNYEKYIAIIEACCSKWKGLTQKELAETVKIQTGGTLTKMIKDLEMSGFLQISNPYEKKKKGSIIRLVDEFSIFYLKFIKNQKSINWQAMSKSSSFTSWQGFAFENLCFKHTPQIKEKLGISGVNTSEHSFTKKGSDKVKGAQIDLLIDRSDMIVNLCEIKFYNKEFSIDKNYNENLLHKRETLEKAVGPKKSVHMTLISTYGVKENKYSSMIQSEIVLVDLFRADSNL